MNEQIERFIKFCQELTIALYDLFDTLMNDLSNMLEEVNWEQLVAYHVNSDDLVKEFYEWQRKERLRRYKENQNRRVFEQKVKYFKPNKFIKNIQMNVRKSPKNWTGKNFKRVVKIG